MSEVNGEQIDLEFIRHLNEVVQGSGDEELSVEEKIALGSTEPHTGARVLAFLISRHVSKRELAAEDVGEEEQAA